MRVLTVVGNRPHLVKAAAVSAAMRGRHEEVLVHTGQHHDETLSAVFFEELGIATPDYHLGVAGGGNTSQLARMLAGLADVLAVAGADVALVYGDTNSTLAGALAAADAGLPLAHVEAGMRCFDRTMPEERNRVLVDQLAALLLCSSPLAAANLAAEGVPGEAVVVGDVMVDVALARQERARLRREPLERFALTAGEYVLATAHRAANVDDAQALAQLVELLEAVPDPVVLPLHPRTRARLAAAGLLERLGASVTLCEPLGYDDFTTLLCNARAVLTDSGGVQKEAYLAGVLCVTLRERTEWEETVAAGWNVVVGLDRERALAALQSRPPAERPQLYGDGDAAARVVSALDSLVA